MTAAAGFEYRIEAGGTIIVLHHKRVAATLRGAVAGRFLAEIERDDPQLVMARITGNYRRGNERSARQHPRNSGR